MAEQHFQQKLSFFEKAGYSAGDAAANFVFMTMILFQTNFYTDVFGISAAAAGAILLSARLWDAFFDPIMGVLADRTNTRWGRFRPWVLWTSLPWAVVMVLAYTTPHGWGMGAMIAYAAITNILLMTLYSMNNMPYSALGGVMTGDVNERAKLNSFRFIAVNAAQFIVGGLTGLGTAMLAYMVPIAGNMPGIVEESAKLLAVILVARGVRYKYELNGILFGATVGAGFACFETCGYGFDQILSTLTPVIQAGNVANGFPTAQALVQTVENMMANLVLRGVESPLGHVAWTAIAAGAFWRVKGDKPTSPAMLLDTRFLKAFAIPVLMHTTWDLSILFPNIPTIFAAFILPAVTGLITWYVLFGLVQQGLKQVKDEQVTHLQSTLATVEATLGLGTYRQPMAPAPVGTVPVA